MPTTTVVKLSYEAASLMFEELKRIDQQINAQTQRIGVATATISDAHQLMLGAWGRRKELADELARLAPDDFNVVANSAGFAAVSSSNHRFSRPHPFPYNAHKEPSGLAGLRDTSRQEEF